MSDHISPEVLFVVLAAAALHAGWNAVLKSGRDRYVASLFVAIGGGIVSIPAALVLPLPAPESWPYIAASAIIHVGYFVLLGLSYRTADLSVAYPLMRGGAPLLTALLGQVGFGDAISPAALTGVVVLSAGVVLLGADAIRKKGMDKPTAVVVLAMVAIIVAYTICDGLGARLAGSPTAYLSWMFICSAPVAAMLVRLRLPAAGPRILLAVGSRPILGGFVSFIAYALALWAMTQAPISLVAALRETSVLFAVLIGICVFKEKVGALRVASALAIVGGITMMRLA